MCWLAGWLCACGSWWHAAGGRGNHLPYNPTPCSPPSWCSREKLFNIIIGVFLAFYGSFALLYPHHDYLHLDILAARLVPVLPSGLSGAQCGVLAWPGAGGQRWGPGQV